MRILAIAILLFGFSSCSKKHDEIIGLWEVKTSYYKAQYKIYSEDDGFDCRVMLYNDGTKRYNYERDQPYFLFKGLKWSEDKFVDGTSGATKSTSVNPTFSVELVNQNTLEVVNSSPGSPRTEIWKRVNK